MHVDTGKCWENFINFFLNSTTVVLFIHLVSPPTKRLVLLLSGSFNPVTIAHLRMLELARDYYHIQSIQVLEGIISPVSDFYGKPGLVKVNYRIEMVEAAIRNNHWLRVDTWEAEQTTWTRTKKVLDHHYEDIKKRYGENTELRLLSGADVARSMLNPKIWLPKDIDDIMTNYGLACITRLSAPESGQGGATVPDVKEGMPDLWKQHIEVIQDWVVNDISATNIRNKLEKGFSVKYIVPDATIEVIRKYGLYNSNKSICLSEWPYEKKQT
ncbi:unnamed protein product [Rotaria sordida]|uniref:Nicotinamide-nucleotide adenylyltransferase n=1 Tax=Rotaria sordida TaxID=392033 RepID=A0A814GI30_9BILA|nr:unnamed protein product [Rotaria sordida]CAF3782734.1 unnamed protein product [Rotaria sordida]